MAASTKGIAEAEVVEAPPAGHSHPEAIRSDDEITDVKHAHDSISQASDDTPVIEGKDEEAPVCSISSNDEQELPKVVPRLKRRGLFGQLTFLAEVENPKIYPRKTKWFITFVVAVAGAAAPMGSSIFFRKSTVSLDGDLVSLCAYRKNSFPFSSIQRAGHVNYRHKLVDFAVHA